MLDSPGFVAEEASPETSENFVPQPETVSVSTVLPGEATTETALTQPELPASPQSVSVAAATKMPEAVPDQKLKTEALKFLSLLTWCWLVGVGIAGLVPLVGLAQVFRLRRGATTIEDESWLALLDDVSRELRIRRPVRLLKSPRTKMPLTWGVLRPVVLVPDEAESWSGSRRRMVLLHELAHVKRLDWLTQMVGQAACSLHWFNPLVWLAARRMQVEREQACDDMVLAAGTPASEYASELLHFASRLRTGSLSALAAVPMARQTSLEQRVRGILDGSRRRAAVTRVAMVLGLAVCCGVLVPLAMLQASAQDEPPGKVEGVEDAAAADDDEKEPASDEADSEEVAVDSDDEPPKTKTAKKTKDQSKDKAVSLDPSQKWKLKGGVTAEVKSSVFHGADVMTTVTLHWPAKGKRPALQYSIHVAADAFGNRESWSVVWERGTTRLWVASSGYGAKYPNLRTIDFRDPNRIYTWTHYGSKKFKTTEPEVPTVNARRQGVSIGEPPPRVPEPVMEKLAVKMPLVRNLKKEGEHYSGNHIDAASVKAEWIVTGTVRDLQKRPMKGVLVEVYTEFHPTTRIAVARTNREGEYSLLFRMDLRTLNEWRGLTVAPRIAGFVDDDFGRSGELTMLLREGEKIKNRFSEKNAIVGEPVTADFLIQPAATVTGQIRDSNGKPWADSYLGLKFEGQRRGYSVVSSGTDKDGNFRMTNVPTEKPLQLITSRPNRDETIVIGTVNAKRTNAVQHLRILKGNEGWKIDNLVFNVPARVRVVEGQDEIEPPKQVDSFVQKVIDWAESCRLNRSGRSAGIQPGRVERRDRRPLAGARRLLPSRVRFGLSMPKTIATGRCRLTRLRSLFHNSDPADCF